ncbi:hypothetical protein B0J15DRAFT_562009 [Fusarium solani]|uniref:Uncharacterized protein n=1 Tax=Fusarium solani TaxID=169388 RepID=A0A9P9H1S8_FUSSL|nr:uncharacterized protein B0J15DRAFT_562009 [Fusarium solani]KAH7249580.1 hypothetical protein B0J15DRAFT_562009 [Fusarium solani]
MLPSPSLSVASSHTLEALDDVIGDMDELVRVNSRPEATGLSSPIPYCSPTEVKRAVVECTRRWEDEGYPEGICLGTEWIDDEGILQFREIEKVEMCLSLMRVNPAVVDDGPLRLALGSQHGHVVVCYMTLLTAMMTWSIMWMAENPVGVEMLDPRIMGERLRDLCMLDDGVIVADVFVEMLSSIPVRTLTGDQLKSEMSERAFDRIWVMGHQWMHERDFYFRCLCGEAYEEIMMQWRRIMEVVVD